MFNRNTCLTSSNKCLTSSNKKLPGTSALLIETSALLLGTIYIFIYCFSRLHDRKTCSIQKLSIQKLPGNSYSI